MKISDFKRLIQPLKNKIFLLVGRALLHAVNNSETTQKIQVVALRGETITDMERFQEYGFETYPFTGSEVAAIFLNGKRDHGIALCIHDRRYRPQDLSEGEVAVYTDEDSTTDFRIWLKRNRILNILADQLIETLDTNKTVTVPSELHTNLTEHIINSPKVTLGAAAFAAANELIDARFTALFNDHVHSQGNDSDGNVQVNTDAPTTTLGAAHRTSKTKAL